MNPQINKSTWIFFGWNRARSLVPIAPYMFSHRFRVQGLRSGFKCGDQILDVCFFSVHIHPISAGWGPSQLLGTTAGGGCSISGWYVS